MPDKKTEAVLAMLARKVGYSYKVVEKSELVQSLPRKYSMSVEQLLSAVAFLRENDFVAVKYQDKDEICLSLTVKAETFFSQSKHAVRERCQISHAQIWLMFLGTLVASFLGTLLANLLF